METDGLELPSGNKIKEVEDGGYKYLGITGFDNIKDIQMKESFRKEYLCRAKAVVSLMRDGAGIN